MEAEASWFARSEVSELWGVGAPQASEIVSYVLHACCGSGVEKERKKTPFIENTLKDTGSIVGIQS